MYKVLKRAYVLAVYLLLCLERTQTYYFSPIGSKCITLLFKTYDYIRVV